MGAPSFRAWHVIARILDGDAALLSAEDRSLAEEITQRTRFPAAPITEFYAGPGRRSGKSRFIQCRAAYQLAQDCRDKLAPGERAVIACVAPSTDQAAILFNYASATVHESALLASQLVRETASELEFAVHTVLKVYAGSFRTTRGPTYKGAYLDEASYLRSEDSALPDVELIRALRPGLITLGGDLFVTSSPYMKRGAMFEAYRKHFGNNDSPALYVAGPSILFNPTLNQAAIAQAFEDDAEGASSEWGGLYRNNLTAPFAELVDAAIDTGVFQREPLLAEGKPRLWDYVSFTDPSGGQGKDSWSTRVVHVENDIVFDDAVLEIRPPFNTDEAAQSVAQFLKSYGITHTQGDRYAGAWPSDALRRHGMSYSVSDRDKSTIYKEVLPLFSSHRARLLDHKRTATQLRMIERRTRAGGKDSFDHPPGGSDDNANALCGAVLLAGGHRVSPGDNQLSFTTGSIHEIASLELAGVSIARDEAFTSVFDEREKNARDPFRDLIN